MSNKRYDVVECEMGTKNLKKALADIAAGGGDVVSVLPDHGGSFLGMAGSGRTFGYLIVVAHPAAA